MANKLVLGVGEFRQRATEIIREVEETARTVVIARRGRPVVEIRAITAATGSLAGSVTVAEGVDLTQPAVAADDWEALA